MKKIVTEAMVFAHDSLNFSIDSSEVGLTPGEWPHEIETTLGNKQPFLFKVKDGDAVVYQQRAGVIQLMVFND